MKVKLFSLRACRSLQDWNFTKVLCENGRDEDVLFCVVKFITLTFSQCCFYILSSSQGSDTVEKWWHGVLHGPSLRPVDRPVNVLNQPNTCYGETACASKKCWYTDSSTPPVISPLSYAGNPRVHSYHTEISYKRRFWSGKGRCVLLHDQYGRRCCALTSKE